MKRTTTYWTPITICIMNWLDNNTINFKGFGLIALSALFSCEDPGELGLQLIDTDDDLAVIEAEFPLQASIVRLDSINTTNRGIMMTGNYTDADFGNVDVQSFFRVLPPTTSINVPEEVMEADSLKMDFRINYLFGDEFVDPVTLSVHRLEEQLVGDSVYFSNSTTPFDPNSLEETALMIDQQDTLVSLNLEPLKDELFTVLRDYQSDSANAANFLEQFKGFSLLTAQGSNAVLGFDPQGADSEVTLYYTTQDTVVNTITVTYSTYYNRITPDFTGTPLEGIEPRSEFNTPTGDIFLQTGTGIVPKINFEAYYDFLDQDTTGTVVVNKAEIIFSDLRGLEDAIDPPVQMGFYYTDDTNAFLQTATDPPFPNAIQTNGVYISATRNEINPFTLNSQSQRAQLDTLSVQYSPEITLFLQLIADGLLRRDDVQNVLAVPFSFVENPTSVRDFGRNLDRFFMEPESLKLRISYTRLK